MSQLCWNATHIRARHQCNYREDHLGAPELSFKCLVHDLIAAVDLVDEFLLMGGVLWVRKGGVAWFSLPARPCTLISPVIQSNPSRERQLLCHPPSAPTHLFAAGRAETCVWVALHVVAAAPPLKLPAPRDAERAAVRKVETPLLGPRRRREEARTPPPGAAQERTVAHSMRPRMQRT
jgi:hypothetical protein